MEKSQYNITSLLYEDVLQISSRIQASMYMLDWNTRAGSAFLRFSGCDRFYNSQKVFSVLVLYYRLSFEVWEHL